MLYWNFDAGKLKINHADHICWIQYGRHIKCGQHIGLVHSVCHIGLEVVWIKTSLKHVLNNIQAKFCAFLKYCTIHIDNDLQIFLFHWSALLSRSLSLVTVTLHCNCFSVPERELNIAIYCSSVFGKHQQYIFNMHPILQSAGLHHGARLTVWSWCSSVDCNCVNVESALAMLA